MALPLPPGLTPSEMAFLCEMELVTVIPRQRLEGLELLGGPTQPLNPPFPAPLPLWLALLLKRQRRANIRTPPWLRPDSLAAILEFETDTAKEAFSPPPNLPPPTTTSLHVDQTTAYLPATATTLELSPPFLQNSTTSAPPDALPYHWLELSQLLLAAAPDDFEDPDSVRRLLRDLREVRMAKLRKGIEVLDAGAGIKMNGVGGMEIAESRAFIGGVVDGLRYVPSMRSMELWGGGGGGSLCGTE
ncbi:DNA replication protein psf2 [Elasticomyces elasticus]|nr:DNA replication protein psf2 [Elasticomyces elasticus]